MNSLDLIAAEVSLWTARGVSDAISRLIMNGALPPERRLPTVRNLAARLGLSATTIAAAWKILQENSAIETHQRGGTVVIGPPRPPYPKRYEKYMDNPGQEILDLRRLLPDAAYLPDLDDALRWSAQQEFLHTYRPASIIGPLRHAVRTSWPFPAENFFATNGGYDAIALLIRTGITRDDTVLIENPTSPRYLDLLEVAGAKIIAIDCDKDGPLPSHLEQGLKLDPRMFIYQTRAQSPTGSAVSSGRLAELAEVIGNASVEVVEIDSQHGLINAPDRSLGTLFPGRVAHVKSYSKSLGPDLRLGMIGAPSAVIRRVALARSYDSGWTSRILQGAVAWLLEDPSTQRLVQEAAETYQNRRASLTDALEGRGLEVSRGAGMSLWIPVLHEGSAEAYLRREGILVLGGSRFFASPSADHFVRLCIARPMDDFDAVSAAIVEASHVTHASS